MGASASAGLDRFFRDWASPCCASSAIYFSRYYPAGAASTASDLGAFAKLIAKKTAAELSILHVELFLGIFIGAITFTGSVVAYGKLAGKLTSAATKLPGGHALNAGAAAISDLRIPLAHLFGEVVGDHPVDLEVEES